MHIRYGGGLVPGIYPSGRLCWLAHVTRSIFLRSSIGQDEECSPTNCIIIVPHPSFPSHLLHDHHPRLAATNTRILSTIRRIRDLLPDTVVVLQAVLPRGVDGPDPFRLPNLFTWPLYVVNEHLSHFASEDDNVQFVDCEDHVLTNEGSLDPAALPDGVHPSAPAYQHISRCLDILIGVLVEDPLAGRA
uniref:SGNH hydrolase-type esterase domain-containing protein n=1 Tax=Auxenochlorella protothecoides TaxID=3075 RepID=A0A1D2A9W0_AUXPR